MLSASCVSLHSIPADRGEAEGVAAEPAVDWVALAGSWRGPEMYVAELITFVDEANGTTYRARFDSEVSSEGMAMVAHTPLGVPLFELKVEDGQMRLQNYTEQIKDHLIEQSLMDFVLAYWPLEQLQAATGGSEFRVLQNQNVREYRRANNTLIKIRLSADNDPMRTSQEIIHYDVPLKLLIETLNVELEPN